MPMNWSKTCLMEHVGTLRHYFELPTAVRILIQAAAVVSCATVGSFAVGALRPGVPLGAIWMLLIPAVIGFVLNRGMTNRIVAAVGWAVVSCTTTLLLVIPAGLGTA